MKFCSYKSLTELEDGFVTYGRAVTDFDFSDLLETLDGVTECPKNKTIYVSRCDALQELPISAQLRDNIYGGMPIQVGFCNGHNRKLNCLEYHRGSELIIAADDVVLLLASCEAIDKESGTLDTRFVEMFLLPAGQAVLLYETTLHYAPCTADAQDCFRTVIVLPEGTNTEKPKINLITPEDERLWGRNTWLLAHQDTLEALFGAYVGLIGDNIDLDKPDEEIETINKPWVSSR